MIVLRNLTKVFVMQGRRKVVADNINAVFPTGTSVGLLGRNGAGKSTLLQMIAGTTHATSGEVLSSGSVSFPVGLASALHKDMTGAQNTRFVARIYGADTDALVEYVEDFAELGEVLGRGHRNAGKQVRRGHDGGQDQRGYPGLSAIQLTGAPVSLICVAARASAKLPPRFRRGELYCRAGDLCGCV